MDPIKRVTFNEPDRARVHESTARAVETDPERFIAAYRGDARSWGGRYVCADLFKEQFSAFAQSNEARNRYNTPVHNPAAVLASEVYNRNLSDASLGGSRLVLLTGIPGAGKTTHVLKEGAAFPDDTRMVYEGQLARAETTLPKVEAALSAGLAPTIVAVHVRPELALDRTLHRFGWHGRGASLQTMAAIQGGTPDGLKAVADRFGDAVRLVIQDRRDQDRPRTLVGWQNLDVLRSEGNRETIEQRLTAAIEQRWERGSLSEAAYRQAKGLAPLGPDLELAAESQRGRPTDDGRPDPARSNSESGLLTEPRPQRLVVYDGQAKLQSKDDKGRWQTLDTRPSTQTPSGLYPLNEAASAARDEHVGPVLHVTDRSVFQLSGGRTVVRHDRAAFADAAPPAGAIVLVQANGTQGLRALTAADVQPPTRGQKR